VSGMSARQTMQAWDWRPPAMAPSGLCCRGAMWRQRASDGRFPVRQPAPCVLPSRRWHRKIQGSGSPAGRWPDVVVKTSWRPSFSQRRGCRPGAAIPSARCSLLCVGMWPMRPLKRCRTSGAKAAGALFLSTSRDPPKSRQT
ncbi:unnamed protein product, partial [Symbiodinium necroappetens]